MRIMGSDPIVNPVANNLAQRRVAAACRWFAILANQAERKREPRGAEEVRYDRE